MLRECVKFCNKIITSRTLNRIYVISAKRTLLILTAEYLWEDVIIECESVSESHRLIKQEVIKFCNFLRRSLYA